MSRAIASAALAGLLATASAEECMSVVDAAAKAGLTGIVNFANKVAKENADDANVKAILPTLYRSEPLQKDLRVTMFAPTNEAFEEGKDILEDSSLYDQYLTLFDHFVRGELRAADITKAVAAASPNPFELSSVAYLALEVTSMDGGLVISAWGGLEKSKIVNVDIETCIGPMHVIDKVIFPAFHADSPYPAYADYEYIHGHVSSPPLAGHHYDHEHHHDYEHHHYYPDAAPVYMGSKGAYGEDYDGAKAPSGMSVDAADYYAPAPVYAKGWKAPAGVPVKDSPSSASSGSSGSSGSAGSTGSSGSAGSSGSSSGGISGAAIGGIVAGVAAVAVGAGYAYKRRRVAGPAGHSAALSV